MELRSSHIFCCDDITRIIYLQVAGRDVVLLQAFFELSEGIGVVRTISIKDSIVCILTTDDLLKDCIELLRSIRGVINWQGVNFEELEEKKGYI